ncbi:MAG: hypothetical protein HPY80_08175 [Bacteroidales bacterium]|nr:hypothetical protein [Bacteroidales bacterium]NPV36632.1 hypothetical protein [Bacteroidales bacterium]
MKRTLIYVVALVLLAACGSRQNKELPKVTFDLTELETMAPQYVGQEITLSGTIDHVCKHGGGRMFLVGSKPSARIRIDAGENMQFDASWEGKTAYVTGILEELRIDSAYLAKWEQEVREKKGGDHSSGVHMGEAGHEKEEEGDIEAELQRIADYRTAILDSGKDHLSFYSVKCTSYVLAEEETAEKNDTTK